MKLSSKFAVLGGFLAGAGAVAFAVLKRKQREEIYHEAEIKAMDELDAMMDQGGDCTDCTGCACAEECAAITEDQAEEAAEAPAEAPAEEAEEAAPAEEAPAEEPEVEVEITIEADEPETPEEKAPEAE